MRIFVTLITKKNLLNTYRDLDLHDIKLIYISRYFDINYNLINETVDGNITSNLSS